MKKIILLIVPAILFLWISTGVNAETKTYTVYVHNSASKEYIKEQVKAGKNYTFVNPRTLAFKTKETTSNKAFMGWIVRYKTSKKWALTSSKSDGFIWGNYKKSKLKYFRAGEDLAGNYSVGDKIDVYPVWNENIYVVKYHGSQNGSVSKVVKKKTGTSLKIATKSNANAHNGSKLLVAWTVSVTTAKTKKTVYALYNKKNNKSSWGVYNKNKLKYVQSGYVVSASLAAGSVVDIYPVWVDPDNIDVTDPYFGVKAWSSSVAKDSNYDLYNKAGIQKALNIAKDYNTSIKVVIPSGNYPIGGTLHIYSNTRLYLASDTTIQRGAHLKKASTIKNPILQASGKDLSVKGYGQVKNIIIEGGTWLGDTGSVNQGATIRCHHCYNVTIRNCNMKDFSQKHAIIIVAGNYITFNHVNFNLSKKAQKKFGISTKNWTQVFGEAIHCDFANDDDGAKPYDYTVCDHVTVKNCTFNNVLAGIGKHANILAKYNSSAHRTHYKIINNTFNNVKFGAINLCGRIGKNEKKSANDRLTSYGNKIINCTSSYFTIVKVISYLGDFGNMHDDAGYEETMKNKKILSKFVNDTITNMDAADILENYYNKNSSLKKYPEEESKVID